MQLIKRIVVGVDFSNYAPMILEYAAGIAERNAAELVAVNVINKARIDDVVAEIDDEKLTKEVMAKFINDEIEKRTVKIGDLLGQWVSKNVVARAVIRSGVPFEEILAVVDEEDADLLVMSSRGRTNFQDFMFGTTAENLFRYCPVSILSLNLLQIR